MVPVCTVSGARGSASLACTLLWAVPHHGWFPVAYKMAKVPSFALLRFLKF